MSQCLAWSFDKKTMSQPDCCCRRVMQPVRVTQWLVERTFHSMDLCTVYYRQVSTILETKSTFIVVFAKMSSIDNHIHFQIRLL